MKTIKKIITTLLIINFSLLIINSKSKAQTVIPAGDVSGVWTAANSPYQIQGDITVQAGQTLEIQAGVKVEFQGYYRLMLKGKLLALGTKDNMIEFTVNDTTGFWNDETNEGGWRGILMFQSEEDITVFDYCKFHYTKNFVTFQSAYSNTHVIFQNNFIYNSCSASFESYSIIKNNIVFNNNGGINLSGNAIFTNNLLCNNKYIALGIDYDVTISNNTICNNGGLGVQISFSSPTFYNCIINGNNPGGYQIEEFNDPKSKLSVNYYNTQIQGGYSGVLGEGYTFHDVVSENPQFMNPTAGAGIEYDALEADWRLRSTSPCVDTGFPDTTGLNIDVIDLAGEPRIYNSIIDMGAYEYTGYSDIPESIANKQQINLYPVPSKETITISFEYFESKTALITVINSTGKYVLSKDIKNIDRFHIDTINLSKLPKGIYFLNIQYGNKSFAKKIIIQ